MPKTVRSRTSASGRKKPRRRLRSRIVDALGLPETAGAGSAFFHALETLPATTIAIDNADAATDEAREELNAFVLEAPENISFIIAARSRSVIRDARLFVEGTAARMPAELLDLTVGEAAELCDIHHLEYTENDLNKLVHHTEGWAIVTAACVREAALAKRTATDAFSGWMREHRTAFIEYVRQEAERSGNSAILERAVSSLTVGNLCRSRKTRARRHVRAVRQGALLADATRAPALLLRFFANVGTRPAIRFNEN